MRRNLVGLLLGVAFLIGCSAGGSTAAEPTSGPSSSVAHTTPSGSTTDISGPPMCGVAITASMPPATRAWAEANRTRNAARARIDAHLAAEGNLTSVDDVRAQVASDAQYAAALRDIPFPPEAAAALAVYLDRLGVYDAYANHLLDQVAQGVDFSTAYAAFKQAGSRAAASAFTEASARLRSILDVPDGTCVFRTP